MNQGLSSDRHYYKELKVSHYKGFYDEQSVKFAIPQNRPGSGLSIIVGPNNVGKTALIEALYPGYFSFDESHSHFPPCNAECKQKIVLDIDDKFGPRTFVEGLSVTENSGRDFKRAFFVPSRRRWHDEIPQTNTQERARYRDYRGMDFVNEFKQTSQSAYGRRFESYIESVAGVVKSISSTPYKNQVIKFMRQVFPEFKDWRITKLRGKEILRYVTDQGEHDISLSGEGYLSVMVIAISLMPRENEQRDVVIIDEPELSLHPQAQKRLAKLLSKEAMLRQIIICTHSPYFIRWEDYEKGAHFVRLSKNNGVCVIKWIAQNHWKPIGLNDSFKPHQWDIVAKELMFTDKVLFVEGQEDVVYIKGYLDKYFPAFDFDIYGYGVGGKNNFENYVELASKLGVKKYAVLIDNCTCTEKHKGQNCETSILNKIRQQFPECVCLQLKTHDIRDKDDVKARAEVRGTFSSREVIKPELKDHFESMMQQLMSNFKNAS